MHTVSIVEAIIRNKKGEILLLKRSKKNSKYVGKWQLPGGKVEFGEKINDAIKREIKEETGCKCVGAVLEKVFEIEKSFNGSPETAFLMVFSARLAGKIALSIDHSELKFFKKDKIKKSLLAPTSKKALFG